MLLIEKAGKAHPRNPCVVHSSYGTIEEDDFLHLFVDKEQAFREKNEEESLAAVRAAYWVLNIKNVLEQFQHVFHPRAAVSVP